MVGCVLRLTACLVVLADWIPCQLGLLWCQGQEPLVFSTSLEPTESAENAAWWAAWWAGVVGSVVGRGGQASPGLRGDSFPPATLYRSILYLLLILHLKVIFLAIVNPRAPYSACYPREREAGCCNLEAVILLKVCLLGLHLAVRSRNPQNKMVLPKVNLMAPHTSQ